jgi:hypothetical protein
MPTYNPLVPTGSVPLNLDYANLQGNFAVINTDYGIDHVPLTDTSGSQGFHNVIHSVPFSTAGVAPASATNYPVLAPAAISGIGEIFTAVVNDGFTTDTALYFQTGRGRIMQLTSNKTPSAASNGYTFLPGGIFLQWGSVSSTSSSSIPVTFNVTFPNNIYNIQLTAKKSGSVDTVAYYVQNSSITTAGFTIIDNSDHTFGYFWTAVGN